MEFLTGIVTGAYSLDDLIRWGGYVVLFAIVGRLAQRTAYFAAWALRRMDARVGGAVAAALCSWRWTRVSVSTRTRSC